MHPPCAACHGAYRRKDALRAAGVRQIRGVTARLEVNYRKSVPLGSDVVVIATARCSAGPSDTAPDTRGRERLVKSLRHLLSPELGQSRVSVVIGARVSCFFALCRRPAEGRKVW